ncbi:hypothetical protein M2318_000443 [Metapseudomonas resinovorans]
MTFVCGHPAVEKVGDQGLRRFVTLAFHYA